MQSIERSVGDNPSEARPESPERIRQAAVELFTRNGYHGTSVRDIARHASISVATLFHHYRTKLDLLHLVMREMMEDLIVDTEAACADAKGDPASQLRAAVAAHVRFHTRRQSESFIGNSELRSLPPEMRLEIISLRDRHQRLFDRIVEAGCATRTFGTAHPRETSRAIVTMSTAVATWFHPNGPLGADQIADIYADLALEMVHDRGDAT